jgi:hypothetical protein
VIAPMTHDQMRTMAPDKTLQFKQVLVLLRFVRAFALAGC